MYEKSIELSPNQELEVGNLGDAYRWSGQKDKAAATYDRAIALAQKELAVNPRNAEKMGALALYFAKKGDMRMAQQYIRRARTIAPSLVELIYMQAVVDTLGGKTADAYTSLRAALEQGYPAREAQNDPELGTLANQPQFQQLLAQFGNKR